MLNFHLTSCVQRYSEHYISDFIHRFSNQIQGSLMGPISKYPWAISKLEQIFILCEQRENFFAFWIILMSFLSQLNDVHIFFHKMARFVIYAWQIKQWIWSHWKLWRLILKLNLHGEWILVWPKNEDFLFVFWKWERLSVDTWQNDQISSDSDQI